MLSDGALVPHRIYYWWRRNVACTGWACVCLGSNRLANVLLPLDGGLWKCSSFALTVAISRSWQAEKLNMCRLEACLINIWMFALPP